MRRHWRGIFLALLITTLVFTPAKTSAGSTTARIAARVLSDVRANHSADFLVVMRARVDPAATVDRSTSRTEQGERIYHALHDTAQPSQSALTRDLQSRGIPFQPFWIVNAVAVRGSGALVAELAARPDVAAIVSNAAFKVPLEQPLPEQPAPSADTIEWGLSWIKAPELWAMGFTGQGIVYASADTGVQWDHPALKGQYRGWDGTTADHNYNWWDGVRSDIPGAPSSCPLASPAPCDDQGHGTHVMGTGVGTSISGRQIGVAPGAQWIACRNMEGGYGRPSTYLSCFQFFLAPTDLNGENPDPSKRPHVVGNSYGCPPSEECIDPQLFHDALESLRAAGIFMATSAGNSGPTCSSITAPPGVDSSVFTIGSIATGNVLSSFSSRGPVTVDGSGRGKPDLVAPGQSVFSSFPGNSSGTISGTSMATPHVSGAVALLWSARPALSRDVAKTAIILKGSAVHLLPRSTSLCGLDTAAAIPNNHFGYGVLDVLAAYHLNLIMYYIPYSAR